MSSRTLSFPVKVVNKEEWLDLTAHGLAHEFCGERVDQKPSLSFAGGHRVRHYSFKKNVHWKVPKGQDIDISEVEPAAIPADPPRRAEGRKGKKGRT